MIPRIDDATALKLSRLARRSLTRRLRLYGMTIPSHDLDDLTTDSLIKALETFHRRPPRSAKAIRIAIWLSVRATLIDWIDKQSTHASHLAPFDDEPVDVEHVTDTDPQFEHRLPAYIGRLCHSVGEIKAAFVLSGQTFDGRVFAEMDNETAAEQLNISIRSVQRMKETLRIRLALFAPETSDTQ